MKKIFLPLLFGIAVSFAENYEFVFPEKIEYQSVSPVASPELARLAKEINKKCPLEPITKPKGETEKHVAESDSVKKDSIKNDSTKKDELDEAFEKFGNMLHSLYKQVDVLKKGENPYFNVALEGVSVDDKYIIFALRYPDAVTDRLLYMLLQNVSMAGPFILEGGEATYGKKDNPFSEKNLQIIAKSGVKLVLRAVAKNGKYADVIIESSQFPIPYVEVPHKNVKKVKGVPAVKIGNQTWMAQNVNKKTPRSKCYENNEKNCKRYGRLYLIEDARKVCPAGWHLPSGEEFKELSVFVEDRKKLMSRNYDEWGRGIEGFDTYGFNAHPSGMVDDSLKFVGGYVPKKVKKPKDDSFRIEFNSSSRAAYFWTSDVPNAENNRFRDNIEGFFVSINPFSFNNLSAQKSVLDKKNRGKLWLSVRCVKN